MLLRILLPLYYHFISHSQISNVENYACPHVICNPCMIKYLHVLMDTDYILYIGDEKYIIIYHRVFIAIIF